MDMEQEAVCSVSSSIAARGSTAIDMQPAARSVQLAARSQAAGSMENGDEGHGAGGVQ